MPEGPEIRQMADRIAAAIAHQPVESIIFAFDRLKRYESELSGRTVNAVQPRGKALLIHFDNQLSIYSHNQLYGVWMVRTAHSYPSTSRQLRLALHNQQFSALLYSASDIDVLDSDGVASHPFLRKLGPDVLATDTTPASIANRLDHPQFVRRQLARMLLDQQCLCGLGNYLRSEVLFVAGLHPLLRPTDCTPNQLIDLAKAIYTITHQSYATAGLTNDLERVRQLKLSGVKRRDYRHYVFARQGRPCYTCATPIVKAVFAGRRCYYCPNCQSEPRTRTLQQ